MWWADKKAKQNLHEEDITWRDTFSGWNSAVFGVNTWCVP